MASWEVKHNMAQINQTDFSMKPQIDVTAIAGLMQRKRQAEIEAKQTQRSQKMQELTQTIGLASNLASNMVDYSKKRQKADFIKSLSESMAASVPMQTETFAAPKQLSSMLPSVSQVASPDLDKMNLMRDAVRVAPEAAAKSAFTSAAGESNPNALARARRFKAVIDPQNPSKPFMVMMDGLSGATTTMDGQPVNPQIAARLQPYFAPQSIQMASGDVQMAPKVPGMISTASPSVGKGKESDSVFALPAPRRVEFVKTIEAVKNDPTFRGESNKLQSARTFSKSLEAKNQILDTGAPLQFRKVFGDTGNISVVEQAASEGDRQIFYRAQQFVNKHLVSGKLTEHNRQIMRDGLVVLEQAAERNLALNAKREADSMKESYPELKRETIERAILGRGLRTKLQRYMTDSLNLGDGFSYTVEE